MDSKVIYASNDVDAIVKHMRLCEIEEQIKQMKTMLKAEKNENFKWYWQQRLDAFQLARDISSGDETYYIGTFDPRVPNIMKRLMETDGKATYAINKLNEHVDKSKMKEKPRGIVPL